MEHSQTNTDSSHESIEIDKKRSSVVTTLPTLPNNNTTEARLPYSFKIRKSVYDVATYYRALSKMTWGVFLENALIQYMDINPVDGAVLLVTKPEKHGQQDLDDWMLEIVCREDLVEFIEKIESTVAPGGKIHKNRVRELQKILKECKKIKDRSPELDVLIKKVRSYFAE